MSNFRENLLEIMQYCSLSQRKVSLATNIPTSNLSDYCNGKTPNIKNLVKLSNYFLCSVDFLVGVVDEDKNKNFNPDFEFAFDIFYARLLELMKERNTNSFYSLSQNTGVHKNTFYNWKTSKNPTIETLIKLSDYFGVSIDYLIGRSESK